MLTRYLTGFGLLQEDCHCPDHLLRFSGSSDIMACQVQVPTECFSGLP